MPKHAGRSSRMGAKRLSGRVAAARAGMLALCGFWLAAGSAHAVTPLNTYFGPGLPLDSYFPEGVPGAAEDEGVTVRSRLRSDYNAQGIREGAFIIRPGFDEQAGYNSNVIGGSIDGKGSSLLSSSGSVSVNSDWTRNSIGLTAGVNDTRYWDEPSLSHTDYNVSAGGAIDLGRDQLDLSASFQSANEEPYDIGTNTTNFIQLAKPLNFTDTDFRVSYNTTFGRFTVTPNVDYQLLRFARGDFTGVPVEDLSSFNQSRRDSNVLQGGFVTRYEFQPNRSALLVINGNYNHYIRGSDQVDIGVVDSTGATILAGLDYELNGEITVRALGGYQQRFFKGNTYSNQDAPIGEADVIWNPTGLTTVTARYARTIEDATTNSVTGYTYDRLSLIVDHELYRNILLQASGHLDNASYQNSNQTQLLFGAGLGVTYLINRNIQTALSYQFIEHDNSGNGVITTAGGIVSVPNNGSNSFGQSIVLLNVKFGL